MSWRGLRGRLRWLSGGRPVVRYMFLSYSFDCVWPLTSASFAFYIHRTSACYPIAMFLLYPLFSLT